MLSNTVASAPLALRKDYRKLYPKDHAVARLLEYGPNPQMTSFEFMRCWETLRDTTGAGYALKELDHHGNVSALWLMKTEYVTPKKERGTGELYYCVRDEESGGETYLHNSLVLAVRHIGSDGVNPVNPLKVLQNSLDYDREVKQFSLDQMKNGMHGHLMFNFRDPLSKEQLEEFDDTIRRFLKSGVLYLSGGDKELTELQNTNVIDPKVFDVENITVSRVARVYNIPIGKLLAEKGSYSNAEQADLNYLKDAILPLARMYEQELSKKLLTEQERDEGMQIKLSLNGYARGDMNTRGNYYFKAVRSAWLSPNGIRELEDLPPFDGGDEYFISKDLVPISGISKDTGETQISSILQIIQAVANSQMEYESAIVLLTSAFPFERETAVQILGDPANIRRIEEAE